MEHTCRSIQAASKIGGFFIATLKINEPSNSIYDRYPPSPNPRGQKKAETTNRAMDQDEGKCNLLFQKYE